MIQMCRLLCGKIGFVNKYLRYCGSIRCSFTADCRLAGPRGWMEIVKSRSEVVRGWLTLTFGEFYLQSLCNTPTIKPQQENIAWEINASGLRMDTKTTSLGR